jgi:MoxR-like ATPase
MSNAAKSLSPLDPSTIESLSRFRHELIEFLKGKDLLVDAIACALISSGHLLLEDVPGVGKTTLIKAISKLIGIEMKRIQCTSDLLPSDILGVEVYQSAAEQFVFHPGAIFSNILLVDELNRASPRTQSALLEAMGEGFVTIDRKTYALPTPFIVFAAQNPADHIGTYPLPESQLDRFSAKLHLNYPSEQKEKEIFVMSALNPLNQLSQGLLSIEAIERLQTSLEAVFISDRIAGYVKRFVDATRKHESLRLGNSTRGGILWLRMAKARAILFGRDYVIPDDLIALANLCLSHRVMPQHGGDASHVIEALLSSVAID